MILVSLQVSRYMKEKMRHRSIWATALRDVRAAKPRPHRPDVRDTPWEELRRLVIHEGKLERNLTSVFSPERVRTIELPVTEHVQSVEFVPSGGGKFLSTARGGAMKLFSAQGDLLQHVPGMCGGPESSRLWSRPISSNTAHVIQIQAAEMYVFSVLQLLSILHFLKPQ
jgi:hypothetical protein